MTTDLTDCTLRARTCRTSTGNARPFRSLPKDMRKQIDFVRQSDGSFLALWRNGGEGEEPPPYWIDENGNIHNI
jgi:hypothetical protein